MSTLSDKEKTMLVKTDAFIRPVSVRIAEIKAQKNYYRNRYRASIKAIWFLLLVIVILVVGNQIIFFSRSAPSYYVTRSDGEIASLQPLAKSPIRKE